MTSTPRERLKDWRQSLQLAFANHAEGYLQRPNAQRLLRQNARSQDTLLATIWHHLGMPDQVALIAVGGYGRGELYPCSDIDLLILLPAQACASLQQQVECLLGVLWDTGLQIGHSVRTLQECVNEARQDVTVMTALLEARRLQGQPALFNQLTQALQQQCDPVQFYQQKMREQQARHAKQNDTAYNLEPNIKESPGGLRDLQMIRWIARSQGLGLDWPALQAAGILSASQARQLGRHERLLQHLRIRLHLLAKRREDRLIFDFQNALAEQLGYVNTPHKRASEQLMQGFYRSARAIMIENEVLLKQLQQRISTRNAVPEPLDAQFALEAEGWLTLRENRGLSHPAQIFESFLLLQKHPQIIGFSAHLIRALQAAQGLINAGFRANLHHKTQFMEILSYPEGVHRCLRAMNRYGILGRYIPAFGRVQAQMQHDLFHVYTVDEHTLNVLGNLRRFAKPELQHEFPLCSQLFASFHKPHLLYLAALFHDIAKGRGGDHSQLGSVDAKRFCRQHQLSREDAAMVSWLVEAHLKMSSTAQKQDLSDPDVIAAFAKLVQNEYRLTALYLLTVADIRGTSPNVWNAWKAKLLESLFLQTRRVLQQSLNTAAQLMIRKQEVLQKLQSFNLYEHSVSPLWNAFGPAYFSRFDSDEIAWQSRLLLPHRTTKTPIARARLSPKGDGIQVMIYSPDRSEVFARICHFFDAMQYNIAQAKIFTTAHGYALNNFIVLEPNTRQVSYNGLIKHIEQGLISQLASPQLAPPTRGRISRQVKHMPITTQVQLQETANTSEHEPGLLQLDIVTSDRPGLLAQMAEILLHHHASLHNAKINTLGNRVEDSFLISGNHGQSLSAAEIQALKQAMSCL